MFEPNTIKKALLLSTIRIKVDLKDSKMGVGTGFIYYHIEGKKFFPYLVSNKHVVSESINGHLQFNTINPKKLAKNSVLGNCCSIEIEEFESHWRFHKNEAVDIAIMPFPLVLKKSKEICGRIPLICGVNHKDIPSEDDLKNRIDAIEDIIFIGYPKNLYDTKNLVPLVRKGITSTPFAIDFEGRPVFIVDASIFHGSSGSPVFICETDINKPKKESRFFFLGILALRYETNTTKNEKYIRIPISVEENLKFPESLDLGVVFKSHLVQKLVEDDYNRFFKGQGFDRVADIKFD